MSGAELNDLRNESDQDSSFIGGATATPSPRDSGNLKKRLVKNYLSALISEGIDEC